MGSGKEYKLTNGDIIQVVSSYADRIVILYNGTRYDRPASLLDGALLPLVENSNSSLTEHEKEILLSAFMDAKEPDHMRRKVIHEGDTVCIQFLDTNKKAVYTLTNNPDAETVKDTFPDEGYVYEKSALGSALLSMGTNDEITYYCNDQSIKIRILSFFLKKEGLYQKMKEQKQTEKENETQKKKRKSVEKAPAPVSKIRTIKTGDTVCIEYLDTKEKKAFKIVKAWVEVHGDYAAKPFRPTSYDSRTITEADPDEDTISETSPLARAVIGKKRGDITSYTVGNVKTSVRIIAFFDNDTWLKKQKGSPDSQNP